MRGKEKSIKCGGSAPCSVCTLRGARPRTAGVPLETDPATHAHGPLQNAHSETIVRHRELLQAHPFLGLDVRQQQPAGHVRLHGRREGHHEVAGGGSVKGPSHGRFRGSPQARLTLLVSEVAPPPSKLAHPLSHPSVPAPVLTRCPGVTPSVPRGDPLLPGHGAMASPGHCSNRIQLEPTSCRPCGCGLVVSIWLLPVLGAQLGGDKCQRNLCRQTV